MAYGMFEPSMLSYGDGALVNGAWQPSQKVPAMKPADRKNLSAADTKRRMNQIDARLKYLRKAYTISDWWRLTVLGAMLDRLKEPYKTEAKGLIAQRKELKAQLKAVKKYTKAEEKLAADVSEDPLAAGGDPLLDAGLVADASGGGLPAGAEQAGLLPEPVGLSTGMKIGIGVGALALLGGIAWFAFSPAPKAKK
jgi:hypothetical protein